jgi:hypothetical protein
MDKSIIDISIKKYTFGQMNISPGEILLICKSDIFDCKYSFALNAFKSNPSFHFFHAREDLLHRSVNQHE